MVTPATSFCEAGSETRKLRGRAVTGDARERTQKKNFEFYKGTPLPLGNFCRARSCARNCGSGEGGDLRCVDLAAEHIRPPLLLDTQMDTIKTI